MRKVITTLFVLSVLALPGAAHAATVDLAWGACAPAAGNETVTVTPGSQVSLYASVLGVAEGHKGYDIQIMYGNATSRTFPDAWAFNPAGCQGSSFITLDHLAPAAVVKVCPTFQGTLQSLQIKDVSNVLASLPYEQTFMRITLANAYPDGNTTQILPGTRYFLMRALFDHSFSVMGPSDPGNTCGGLETPICFALINAVYVNLAEQAIPMTLGRGSVTAGTDAGCPASPVVNKTWGQLKSTYRN